MSVLGCSPEYAVRPASRQARAQRADGSWSRHVSIAGASATLTSLECELSVDEIYPEPLTS